MQVIEEAAFDKMINSCASEGIYDDSWFPAKMMFCVGNFINHKFRQ